MDNVLLFPAGTEIGIEVYNSLKDCKDINLFFCGEKGFGRAEQCGEYHVVPAVSENYIQELNSLCLKLNIDWIIPCHDDVLIALAEDSEKITNAVPIVPEKEIAKITRYKSLTYKKLGSVVKVPKTYEKDPPFPVFVKPDRGQGSQGCRIVNNEKELSLCAGEIVCEYLSGEEYTVDCFSTAKDGLLFAGARVRKKMRNGISVNTETIPETEEIKSFAQSIHNALLPRGGWFFQVKRDNDGILTLLEVAMRVPGSMATHRATGINFPLLSILERKGKEIKILQNEGEIILDRSFNRNYIHKIDYNSVYIDLDDTILRSDGTIHAQSIQFIFQCINKNIPVYLLTRHKHNLKNTLEKYRVSNLFDGITQIQDGSPKSNYIDASKNPIFIDDSFSERLDVKNKLNIPVFDLSMLEVLINGRCL
jgi:carbamoyl-phosphate synthase large subunit